MGRLRRIVLDVDRALRGELGAAAALGGGSFSVGGLVAACVVLGMSYGACMGLFSALRGAEWYVLTAVLKVPLLFLATLAVTFPSLYVFSALEGSPLRARETLRLLVVAIAVDLAVLAGFGPVTAFFSACTTSYPFIKLLNVLMFAVAGLISLGVLRRTMDRVLAAEADPAGAPGDPPVGDPGRRRARRIFLVWILVYAVVGAQMGWVLRPFIGSPGKNFAFFRDRESNVFVEIVETLVELLS